MSKSKSIAPRLNLDGYHQLVCAILMRAVNDVRGHTTPSDTPLKDWATARAFIRDEAFLTWGEMVGFDPDFMREWVRRELAA